MTAVRKILVSLFLCVPISMLAQQKSGYPGQLYQYDKDATSKWSSPENFNGRKGAGGIENEGAKGRASLPIEAGQSVSLLDIDGTGIINRIWITVPDRSPEMLRSLKLEIFWDRESKPAVSVPLGDFFGVGLGKTLAFQNSLFANAEGRSFNCFIPMPFKKGALIKVTNESAKRLTHIFFDVDYLMLKSWSEGNMYFHAYWSRDTATTVGKDFELLPVVRGAGRFLGVNIGINANPIYGDAWWGEGEVKMYLDGDKNLPTLNGTGTEDYIGTGWGQGQFINNFAGCTISDDKNFQWAYYRYHVPDPIFFGTDCRVAIQQLGGTMRDKVLAMQKAEVPLIPVTVDSDGKPALLISGKKNLDDASIADGWTNFYRSDDVSSTAYFYLDKPTSNLPALQPLSIRTYRLK